MMVEPFSFADFLHGPIALVQTDSPVLLIAPSGRVLNDLLIVARQLKARGADLAIISDAPDALMQATAPLALPASLPEWLSRLTVAKGYNPDHPRGLTKVTRTL